MSKPSRKGSLIRVIRHEITPAVAEAEMGLLKEAMLIISGALHFGILHYIARDNRWTIFINPRGKRVARPTDPAWKDVPFRPDSPDEYSLDGEWAKVAVIAAAYPDTETPREFMNVVCLPIASRKRRKALQAEEWRYDKERVSGLILIRSAVPGAYVRIGCFDVIATQGLELGMEYSYGDKIKEWYPKGNDDWFVLL